MRNVIENIKKEYNKEKVLQNALKQSTTLSKMGICGYQDKVFGQWI